MRCVLLLLFGHNYSTVLYFKTVKYITDAPYLVSNKANDKFYFRGKKEVIYTKENAALR